jgi:VIT1/CCC1 family predicted Fe2+/Mn2+ transporter
VIFARHRIAGGYSWSCIKLIPLFPYFFLTGTAGIIASAVGLFAITLMTGRNAIYPGLRQVGFGLATAVVTFGVGRLIGVNVGG